VACFCILGGGETAGFDAFAEPEVWEGGSDDVEGRAARLGEEGEDVLDFDEGSWPYIPSSATELNGRGGVGKTYIHEQTTTESHS
jgi:hypothetical protein